MWSVWGGGEGPVGQWGRSPSEEEEGGSESTGVPVQRASRIGSAPSQPVSVIEGNSRAGGGESSRVGWGGMCGRERCRDPPGGPPRQAFPTRWCGPCGALGGVVQACSRTPLSPSSHTAHRPRSGLWGGGCCGGLANNHRHTPGRFLR